MRRARKSNVIKEEFDAFYCRTIQDPIEYLDLLDRKYDTAVEEGYLESKGMDPMVMCKFIHKNILKDLHLTGKCTGYRKRLLEYLRGLSREQRLEFRDKVGASTAYKNSIQSINYLIKDLDIEEGTVASKRDYMWSKLRGERKKVK